MPIKEYKSHITRIQKEAIGLLSIGTFLEYFDLMLYVHMAALLNELFFPKSDPYTQAIYSAIAFCSTFVFRPLGALIFGWIGDTVGRKTTIVITTFLMSLSCIVMAITPTYSEKGFIATTIITICRIIQGMSSMGEIIGAKLYLTETIQRPHQYAALSLLNFLAALGGSFALGMASFVMVNGLNWRYVFGIGAIVAITGTIARTTLREVPEFSDPKRRIKSILNKVNNNGSSVKKHFIWNEPVSIKTSIALFCIECAWPVCFYIAFIYLGEILKSDFHYSNEQVINNNFIVSIFEILGIIPLIFLGYFIHPILILKIRLIIFSISILILPFLLKNISSPNEILYIQSFLMFFVLDNTPASSILYSYFPIFKRFTYTSFIYALSRALMYVITSFSFIYITEYFGGPWGIIIISTPILCAYAFGILHFQKLEIKAGCFKSNS
ncbi:MAG TPA: MFS transporter [Rickettsia endosymbiont of Bembidion lapponicum]|nr:MFS transporter [Rickettsia endosymbiont of Bembidion lapponicum]